MTMLKITLFCVLCNAIYLRGLRLIKNNIIFHILYIIAISLCPVFLKRIDFYIAPCYEKRGVLIGQLSSALWLAENTSSVWRKCYAV